MLLLVLLIFPSLTPAYPDKALVMVTRAPAVTANKLANRSILWKLLHLFIMSGLSNKGYLSRSYATILIVMQCSRVNRFHVRPIKHILNRYDLSIPYLFGSRSASVLQ